MCCIGKLFYQNCEKEIEVYHCEDDIKYKESFLHNEKKGDWHLFPNCVVDAEIYSEEIDDKLRKISKEAKERNLIPLKKGYRSSRCSAFDNSPFQGSKMFNYLSFSSDEWIYVYDLIFVRFFKKQENNSINCIIESPQIKIYRKGEDEPKSEEYYPFSGENMIYNDMTMENKKCVYFNLPLAFSECNKKYVDYIINLIAFFENKDKKDIQYL